MTNGQYKSMTGFELTTASEDVQESYGALLEATLNLFASTNLTNECALQTAAAALAIDPYSQCYQQVERDLLGLFRNLTAGSSPDAVSALIVVAITPEATLRKLLSPRAYQRLLKHSEQQKTRIGNTGINQHRERKRINAGVPITSLLH